VEHRYLPWDLPGAVDRFLRQTRPCLLILMETELWPNLLAACHACGVPVLLANGRLSARSARGYGRLPATSRAMMDALSLLCVQGAEDRERFLGLGAAPERVRVTGSLKFECATALPLAAVTTRLRQRLGVGRFIWIAASTHPGEEGLVLAAHARLRATASTALLVLAPRHPVRTVEILQLPGLAGMNVARHSLGEAVTMGTGIYLLDTLGDLTTFFGAADAAFVGGSLVPHGGHNVLEPAAAALPVVVGPHCGNFARITADLLAADGAVQVSDASALAAQLIVWFQAPAARAAMGQRAARFVRSHQGALAAVLAAAISLLPARSPAAPF
jgi:3-deoxy-D-manno-octulosonic-acid transferase